MRRVIWFVFVGLFLVITSCNPSGKEKESNKNESFTFAFMTDLHVEYGNKADAGFQKAIDDVNSMNPAFVVMGGDQIADALEQTEETALKRYDLFLELAEGIDAPVYTSVGNHELFGVYESSGISPDHPLYGIKMYEMKVANRYYSFSEKGWRFIILDSIEETENRRYTGHVDSVQISWLIEELKEIDTETPIIIVTHIPLMTVYSQLRGGAMANNPPGLVVDNSKEVLDLFSQHNLKAVLQGHLHFLEDIYTNGVHYITGGAVCAGWWKGPVNGIEEGYLMVSVEGEDLDWEYIDYGWEISE